MSQSELLVNEGLFGFFVSRRGKPIKTFKTYTEAREYADYYNGKKKHKWDVPSGDYFRKKYVCKDCGLVKHSRKEGGNWYNHYTQDGITFDVAPGCKYKSRNEIQQKSF